jgi:hypothetical protein
MIVWNTELCSYHADKKYKSSSSEYVNVNRHKDNIWNFDRD